MKKTLALVGESGSGKSITALACMNLLLKKNAKIEGNIFFENKNLLDQEEKTNFKRSVVIKFIFFKSL